MARNLGVLVRQLLPNSNCIKNHTLETLILAPSSQPKPFSNFFHSPNPRFLHSGRSRICSLYSEARYRRVMFELEDVLLESKPSVIFFFSAPSSAFCALVSPVLQDLIERFPHVKAYKIDASKKDSDYAIRTFNVRAVLLERGCMKSSLQGVMEELGRKNRYSAAEIQSCFAFFLKCFIKEEDEIWIACYNRSIMRRAVQFCVSSSLSYKAKKTPLT